MPKTTLLPMVVKYFESDFEGASHSLEILEEEEAANVLRALPPATAAKAVGLLDDALAARMLLKLPPSIFHEIIERLEPQQGASIFLHLPQDLRTSFLESLDEKRKNLIKEYLTYPEDSAGRIMSTQFLALHSDLKVRDAFLKIRQLTRKGAPASYVYVVDRENRLAGVLNMRDLMMAAPEVSLDGIMRRDIFSVNCFMDREKVANELSHRKFFAAPVVDAENRLLGVVKAEQLISDVQEEATEDILKMFGAGSDERTFSPVSFSLKKRLPWLCVNLATAFLAASVVAAFQPLIAQITVLAVYLPVIAGQGGNAGAQSLAVVMRGLVMREIPGHKARRLILKEAWIGMVSGVLIGLITALIAILWQGNPMLGLVIGLGMLVNMAIAGFAGAGIPIVMKGIGLDPAQCSNIILTTVTDVIGFLSFLGFAMIFKQYLL